MGRGSRPGAGRILLSGDEAQDGTMAVGMKDGVVSGGGGREEMRGGEAVVGEVLGLRVKAVRGLAVFGGYLVMVFVLAASLSPPVYWVCQFLMERGWLGILEGFPFHRYYSRTLQVTAVVLLPLALWLVGIRRKEELGLERNGLWLSDVVSGVLAGLVPVVFWGVGVVLLGAYELRGVVEWWKLARIVLTSGVVAVVEEGVFRGVLLGLAGRVMGFWPAAWLVSVVFGAVHFLRPPKLATEEVFWWSGWEQVLGMGQGWPEWPWWGWGMGMLVAAGLFLAWTVRRTRSLWAAIGVHAGWVAGQQVFALVTRWGAETPDAWLPWTAPGLVSGAVPVGVGALGVLCVSWWALAWVWRKRG